MPVVGIVAEYNPFHNGHLYHLHQAKRLTSADGVVCVMSGNFVQRGGPAVVSKWARAEMALKSGADLVFELPFCFAVRSAYHFARSAIQLLERTGVVTHVCFGAETENLGLLQRIAAVLQDEPAEFRAAIKTFLSRGDSFPLARAKAMSQYFHRQIPDIDPEAVFHTLTGPNNILAVEYLRVLQETKSTLQPVIIPRRQSSYHGLQLTRYASATAIRQTLAQPNWEDMVSHCLPSTSLNILGREFACGRGPVFENTMGPVILALLRRSATDEIARLYDVTEGLENRIKKAAHKSNSLAELKKSIKTKRYNLTRINRILLYVLTNLTKEQVKVFDETGPVYLRLLAFSPFGQKILQKIKTNQGIFLVNRVKQVQQLLPHNRYPVARQMLDLDFMATDLYSIFLAEPHRKGGKDYTTSPVFLS